MQVELFSPHKGQKAIIDGFADSSHKFGIVATGRQFGKSLLAQNLMLYWLLQSPNSKGAWITPVYNQSKKIFNELTNASHPVINKQNKADLTIEFINGSTLQFLSTDNYNTIRGFSFNYMVIDEAAFVKQDAIEQAVMPTLTAIGKKCLIISTPKSKNWFYEYFLRGNTSNTVYTSFKGISQDNPYVSKEFLIEQYKSLPREIYEQEYNAEFSDAGNDVFTNLDLVCMIDEWGIPNRSERYYIGVDTGISNDYTVCAIQSESGRIEKIIRTNGRTFEEIGKDIVFECRKWNVVGGFCETNGIGLAMYELLRPNIKKLQSFTTTQDSKSKAVRKLIYDIQEAKVELPSKKLMPEVFNEMSAYTFKYAANGNISFTHPNGIHDDIVDAIMLANLARNEQAFSKSKLYIGNINKQQNNNTQHGIRI
jgi:hypothetical protein